MKKNIRLTTITLALLSFIAWSCQKGLSDENVTNINRPHSVTVYLTDHQTPVFDSVFIDFQQLEVKLDGGSLSNGGWISLNISQGVYNVLRFRNGLDTLFATGTLPTARLRKIRLTVGTQNSVMKNGQHFPLLVKDNDRQVIADIDNSGFEIIPPGQVLFWIDFDASRSIQVDNSGPGNNNGYRLKCHIKIFTHRNTGSIEGRVLPLAADPLVMAISGSDTATAIPDRNDGKFKIVGLNAGIYRLFIDGHNNYIDTTINNIRVRNAENTRIADIILRQ